MIRIVKALLAHPKLVGEELEPAAADHESLKAVFERVEEKGRVVLHGSFMFENAVSTAVEHIGCHSDLLDTQEFDPEQLLLPQELLVIDYNQSLV